MADQCGYEFMEKAYYDLIADKEQDDEVVGGSILHNFIKTHPCEQDI